MYTPTDIQECLERGAESFHVALAACAGVSVSIVMERMEYPQNSREISIDELISIPWKSFCKSGLDLCIQSDTYDWQTSSIRQVSCPVQSGKEIWWVAVRRGLYLDHFIKRWVNVDQFKEFHGGDIEFVRHIFSASIK